MVTWNAQAQRRTLALACRRSFVAGTAATTFLTWVGAGVLANAGRVQPLPPPPKPCTFAERAADVTADTAEAVQN